MSTPETTPRLSDLIREGLVLQETRENHCAYFEHDADTGAVYACALGMAYYAWMRRQGTGARRVQTLVNRRRCIFQELFPDDLPERALIQRCPADDAEIACCDSGSLLALVDHLHNIHEWPAQRIASWLDEVMPQPPATAVRS